MDTARARTWARRTGMPDDDTTIWTPADLDAHDHGLLGAYTHPDCDVAEPTRLTDWYVWFFYFGDHFLQTYTSGGGARPVELRGRPG